MLKAGNALFQQPASPWTVTTNYFFCEFDHAAYTRFGDRLHGPWSVLLNILNVEAQAGHSEDRFAAPVTGLSEEVLKLDCHSRPLAYVHVLRPWRG